MELLFIAISILAAYFFPTIIAKGFGRTDWVAIFVVNMFLGWTFVFWVISLAWAVIPNNKAGT